MSSRQTPAVGPPPTDLTGFPRWRLRRGSVWRRAHRAENSPWWFSADFSGRFDLTAPAGTCYLAADIATALREKFGHALVRQGAISFEAAAPVRVSRLRMPVGRQLADLCAEAAAGFGATRELGSCAEYATPQAWAAALQAELGGIRYQTRFTTGARPNAVALFDEAGERDWPRDSAPLPGVSACEQVGIKVIRRPARRELRIIEPPPR